MREQPKDASTEYREAADCDPGGRRIVFGVAPDGGFVLYLKRLERGRFQLPAVNLRTRHVEMEPAQLAMLLDGIDLNARRLARWNPASNKGIDTDLQV
jgi:transposase